MRVWQLAVLLIGLALPASAAGKKKNGIVDVRSNHSVDETVDRVKNILQSKGVTLFALIDHSGEAAKVGNLYESPYSKWASTRLYAGCLLPLTKHLQLDPYYEHENNTGKHPNQQVNAGGLALSLYLPPYKP